VAAETGYCKLCVCVVMRGEDGIRVAQVLLYVHGTSGFGY
jgi:hypothetical protein